MKIELKSRASSKWYLRLDTLDAAKGEDKCVAVEVGFAGEKAHSTTTAINLADLKRAVAAL